MINLVNLICGILFGLGLTISGMTKPSKVTGFLDIFGTWDPSLIFVMASGIAVFFLGYHFKIKTISQSVLGLEIHIPTRKDIDSSLIGGAALFGAGWGLAGLCPGPAMASLSTLDSNIFVFVAKIKVI